MVDSETQKFIDELVSDRQKFNEFVYTSAHDALNEIDVRSNNKNYLKYRLPDFLPKIMLSKACAVLARPVASPNYEVRRFIHLADATDKLHPIIFEYTKSKFVPQNECKYSLARMAFYFGKGKKFGSKMKYSNIIEIQSSSGKFISDIKTKWGQSLTDFHHELFDKLYSSTKYGKDLYFDGSDWYKRFGNNSEKYYESFLRIFLRNNILFDNFLLDRNELDFTKEIFLPAFIKIFKETKVKPLIIALEHTETEGDAFWTSYPSDVHDYLLTRLSLIE